MIPKADINYIRENVDIIKFLESRGVASNKAGISWLALCPIHSERTPSFNIKAVENRYHCFGCGSSGDIINLVQELDQLSFSGAIEEIAEYAGIVIKKDEEDEEFKKLKRLYALTETVSLWFRENFTSLPDEHPAKENLSERRLLELANEDPSIGYAPNNGMVQHLTSKGYSIEEIHQVGLMTSKDGREWASYRKRLIWSIRNIQGKVVGFSARKVYENDNGPKYINSPQTRLYNKSHTLFGLYEAHKHITKQQSVFVVEGQTDVMAMRAAGVLNVVASNGTAFGKDHAEILYRLADRARESKQFTINFCFDNDPAGVKAAKKMFTIDSTLQTLSNVVTIPDGDPDDVRRNQGDEALVKALENRVPLLEFILRKELEEWDITTPEGQSKFLAEANKLLSGVDNSIVLDSYKRKLSWWTGVPLSEINLRRAPNKTQNNQQHESNHSGVSEGELRKRVLAALIQFPEETMEAIAVNRITMDMFQNDGRIIIEEAFRYLRENGMAEDAGMRTIFDIDAFSNPKLVTDLMFVPIVTEEGASRDRIKSIVNFICHVFIAARTVNENNMVQARIVNATEDGGFMDDETLLKEIVEARKSVARKRPTTLHK